MTRICKLLMALAFMVTMVPSFSSATVEAGSQNQVLSAVNAIRANHRLPALRWHPSLQKAAREQAALMAKAGKMSHRVRRGQGFGARMKRIGYGGLAAENIARGQPSLARVLRGWMNSPGHRRNMLHPRMRFLGLAAVEGGGRNYWAMVLGG